ncbi:MAG: hypothetical protein K2Q14_02605 [Gammaproteobacteria bacterium]|nr:hypothetical protein [Gammaproteobacteria bacterium]
MSQAMLAYEKQLWEFICLIYQEDPLQAPLTVALNCFAQLSETTAYSVLFILAVFREAWGKEEDSRFERVDAALAELDQQNSRSSSRFFKDSQRIAFANAMHNLRHFLGDFALAQEANIIAESFQY